MVAIVKPTFEQTKNLIGQTLLNKLSEILHDCCMSIRWIPEKGHFFVEVCLCNYHEQRVITTLPLRKFINAMDRTTGIQWREELTEVTEGVACNVANWVRSIERRIKSKR